jgi:hypothetical protein
VVGCCECGDERLGSCATELVSVCVCLYIHQVAPNFKGHKFMCSSQDLKFFSCGP